MKRHANIDLPRRRLIRALFTIPALGAVACNQATADTGAPLVTGPTSLEPTPVCDDGDDDPTPSQTEGPYFKSSSPERTSLIEGGVTGTRLTVTGRVLSTACQPIARAKLDFWQADNAGTYDNSGFRLRGHQYTDANGRYTLETVVPGLYPGRTRHIHVKVQAPNGAVLTTQLYFPNEPRNTSDGTYNPALLMSVTDSAATFTFVV